MFCSKCGTKVDESAQFCQKCGTPIRTGSSAPTPPSIEDRYNSLPWYRRSGPASALVLLGLVPLVGSITLLIVCIVLVSGGIYYRKARENGELKKWSVANTVVAWLLLIGQAVVLVLVVLGGMAAIGGAALVRAGSESRTSATDSSPSPMSGMADVIERQRGHGNEASAIGALRAINSGQATFASSCGQGFYAPSFHMLGVPPQAAEQAFIPSDLLPAGDESAVKRSGYSIEMSGESPSGVQAPETCNGFPAGTAVASYTVLACPQPGEPGTRCFKTDAAVTIYGGPSKSGPWQPLQ